MLTLLEYKVAMGIALSQEQLESLRRVTNSISISPSGSAAGCYDLTPGSTIGSIQVGSLAVTIRPKLPVDRVLFLMSYAVDPKHWQTVPFDYSQEESLFEAVVPGFVVLLRRALDRGPLLGYRSEESASQIIRGQLRLGEQIGRRYGRIPPAEIRYDEFTEDIEENRLLKAALRRLACMRIRSEGSRHALRDFDRLLANVRLVGYDPRNLPDIAYTRLNEHYRMAVELAKLILRSMFFELHHGHVTATSFLVDMNRVFEDFIVVALREALRVSKNVLVQHAKGRPLYLDSSKMVKLEPDLSWWDGARCTFVGDAKYKREARQQQDLYQILAYTIAANLQGGLLIYAGGEGEPAVHQVVNVGKELEVVSLDLAGAPNTILSHMALIADRVRTLRRGVLSQPAVA